eukprot:SAG31_NODE_29613_length_392_cov_1.064846_1_plen_50_part_10
MHLRLLGQTGYEKQVFERNSSTEELKTTQFSSVALPNHRVAASHNFSVRL